MPRLYLSSGMIVQSQDDTNQICHVTGEPIGKEDKGEGLSLASAPVLDQLTRMT